MNDDIDVVHQGNKSHGINNNEIVKWLLTSMRQHVLIVYRGIKSDD